VAWGWRVARRRVREQEWVFLHDPWGAARKDLLPVGVQRARVEILQLEAQRVERCVGGHVDNVLDHHEAAGPVGALVGYALQQVALADLQRHVGIRRRVCHCVEVDQPPARHVVAQATLQLAAVAVATSPSSSRGRWGRGRRWRWRRQVCHLHFRCTRSNRGRCFKRRCPAIDHRRGGNTGDQLHVVRHVDGLLVHEDAESVGDCRLVQRVARSHGGGIVGRTSWNVEYLLDRYRNRHDRRARREIRAGWWAERQRRRVGRRRGWGLWRNGVSRRQWRQRACGRWRRAGWRRRVVDHRTGRVRRW
jgi:hypothetical protein